VSAPAAEERGSDKNEPEDTQEEGPR
jgi:hypothetical protein